MSDWPQTDHRRSSRGAAAALICCLLAACAQAPVTPDESAESTQPVPAGSPNPALERQQRERARELTRQGAFGEAAVTWEILALLRPDVPEYAENQRRARSRSEARAAQRIQAADQARRRGNSEQAAQLYLRALADDPLNSQATEALRALERERNKRNHLGRPSRLTLTRSAMAEAEQSRPSTQQAVDRNDLEHAVMLMHQSEFGEAIELLERYVKAFPHDEAGRRALAEACYQSAERKLASDPKTARSLLQRAAKLDPSHDQAAKRLMQLDGAPAKASTWAPGARR